MKVDMLSNKETKPNHQKIKTIEGHCKQFLRSLTFLLKRTLVYLHFSTPNAIGIWIISKDKKRSS